MVRTLKQIQNHSGWGNTSKEPMWTFDVNYVTQNNIYVQLLATRCVFNHFYMIIALSKLDWLVQEVISSCLFFGATPGNWASVI